MKKIEFYLKEDPENPKVVVIADDVEHLEQDLKERKLIFTVDRKDNTRARFEIHYCTDIANITLDEEN